MILRKLVDNGIEVEFMTRDKKYTVAKNIEGYYYITSLRIEDLDYPDLFYYEVVDTIYWEDVENFIERLVEEVEND